MTVWQEFWMETFNRERDFHEEKGCIKIQKREESRMNDKQVLQWEVSRQK